MFGVCFESVWRVFVLKVFVLKVSKDVCFESEQATTNVLPTKKVFVHFLLSFDIAILPLIGKKPYLWM